MFEYHNNILCVQAGWLYGTGEILSKPNYDALLRRRWLNVLRRACKGTPALVEYDSIPTRFRKLIEDKVGDPRQATRNNGFNDYLKNDPQALKYYSDFTLDNGDTLPKKAIEEYVANAVVLNAINEIVSDIQRFRRTIGGKKSDIWSQMSKIVSELPRHTYPHSLPQNVRRLKEKYRIYKTDGYYSLIHQGYCNKNSEKINDEAKAWILSRWADRVDRIANITQLFNEYNKLAVINDWKPLKEDRTLYNYLHQEEIKHLWYAHRYGELKAKEKFMYQHSTKMPTLRDSLWYADGTKLNLYYQDEDGKMKTKQVYEVMDAYSEVLLGFHVSDTEDHTAQYFAFKMAARVSGHRPYELRFDGQGGHKKLATGEFLAKLAHLPIKTQPYNGKSKTIESAFGRFQTQILKRIWFFTGQNITAVSLESKANMEMILANKSNLPTLDQAIAAYVEARKEWGSAPHPILRKPRLDLYLESVNPDAPALEIWDTIEMFWIIRKKPVMLSAYGLSFTENKVRYDYMKYNSDGLPDTQWLSENIDRKFIVKYDPEDMSLIHVYKETPSGLRHVTALTKKVVIHRGKQEQEAWESEFIAGVDKLNKLQRVSNVERMEEILAAHGATAEDYGLVSPNIKGVTSKRSKGKDTYGTYQKKVSNAVAEDEGLMDLYDMV